VLLPEAKDPDHDGKDLAMLATRAHYLGVINVWKDKYLEGNPT